jgi:hypothetical protein
MTIPYAAAHGRDWNNALVYLIQGVVSQGLELPKIQWIEG